MHDARDLENLGTRSILVVTKAFVSSALAHAKHLGKPDFRPIIIPHPIPRGEEALGLLADQVFKEALAQLNTAV